MPAKKKIVGVPAMSSLRKKRGGLGNVRRKKLYDLGAGVMHKCLAARKAPEHASLSEQKTGKCSERGWGAEVTVYVLRNSNQGVC